MLRAETILSTDAISQGSSWLKLFKDFIMSIIQQTIARADSETRYLRPGEIDQIKDFLMSGDRRVKLAKTLTESRGLHYQESGQ